jgi:hypothetical protein
MPTLNAPGLDKDPSMAHVYGNVAAKRKRVTVPIGQAVGDLINFMRLPARSRILDFIETHDGANTAATTATFGLAAVPGGPTTFVDADYFLLAATDLNAAGRNRWNNLSVYSVLLDGDYYVQAVLAGANTAGAAMDIEVTVLYEFVGNL